MKMTSRRHVLGSMAGAAILSPVSVFAQQAAPDPVRVVMPFPPGNPFDATIRKTLEVVQRQRPGRTWIVDNKPGAAGIIGTAEVARAKPDGLTLLFTTGGHTTTAITHRKLPYDPERDFVPITRLTESAGFVLLVPANSPFRSVQELVAAAKEKPDTISYASAGVGNGTHLVGALFERAAGIKLIHTPYKALPIPDLIGGHVNMLFWGSGNSKQLVDEHAVRGFVPRPDVVDLPRGSLIDGANRGSTNTTTKSNSPTPPTSEASGPTVTNTSATRTATAAPTATWPNSMTSRPTRKKRPT